MIHLTWIHTSDIHGALFREDAHALEGECKAIDRSSLILSDGGDQLHGTLEAYYASHVSEAAVHPVSEAMNRAGYDVGCVGNHDIEAGPDAYNLWMNTCSFPVLGANVIDVATSKLAFQPYTIIERQGLRIAVLGLVTSAIPNWLNSNLWRGFSFADMVDTARYWVARIQKEEKPDLLVGLFHSGWEGGMNGENDTRRVAENVEGFDFILYGHDHHSAIHEVKTPSGRTIKCYAPSSYASSAVKVEIEVSFDEKDAYGCIGQNIRVHEAKHTGTSVKTYGCIIPWEKVAHIVPYYPVSDNVIEWKNEAVCLLPSTIYERDAFFGSSAFVDIVHSMLLDMTDAQISFASPVAYDTILEAGTLCVKDVYSLYPFTTQLYLLRLTGKEVVKALEYSYSLWVNEMHSPEDDALLMDYVLDNGTRKGLKNISYNLLSAAGIHYQVDLTKPYGSKVTILDDDFSIHATYLVAVNSYHGNGGGRIFTEGIGLSTEALRNRIEDIVTDDMRKMLMEYLRKTSVFDVSPLGNWTFEPSGMYRESIGRDRRILFP